MDFRETEEESVLVAAAARFGEERLRPGEREHEAARGFPPGLIADYAELGFADLGGDQVVSPRVQVALWAKVAEADPGAPVGLDPIGPIAGVLARSERGRALLDQGVPGGVEVDTGLAWDGDRVTGKLAWVPGRQLEWLVLITDERVALIEQPRCRDLETRPVGLRACGGVEVELESTSTTELARGEAAAVSLAEVRTFAAACLLGAARDAHRLAAEYAMERVAFGKPIAHHQGLAFQLADCATAISAADLLLAAAVEAGAPAQIASAHAFVCETALHVAERSVQTLGGHGYLYDHAVEKRMRDIRALASLWGGATRSEHHAATTILEAADALEMQP